MTIQISEKLIINDLEHDIDIYPLNSFLEKLDEKINFEFQGSALWRGYLGTWELKENNLYLIDLKGKITNEDNFNIHKLFPFQNEVFAYWFDGEIILRMKNEYINDIYYDDFNTYLKLIFEKGSLIERVIYKEYKGKIYCNISNYLFFKINDILLGKFNQCFNTSIKNYINEVINFYLDNNYKYNIYLPKINQNESTNISTMYIRNYKFDFKLEEYCLDLNFNNRIIQNDDIKKLEELSFYIEKVLKSDFTNMILHIKIEYGYYNTSEKTMFLNPDYLFLSWLIMNINDFYLPPSIINLINKINVIKTFKTERINSTYFKFYPVKEYVSYCIPNDILNENNKKFYEKFPLVKYNNKKNYYELNMESYEVEDRYCFYQDNYDGYMKDDFEDEYHTEFHNFNESNDIDWSNYNDNLDMDQQSPEFWDQF